MKNILISILLLIISMKCYGQVGFFITDDLSEKITSNETSIISTTDENKITNIIQPKFFTSAKKFAYIIPVKNLSGKPEIIDQSIFSKIFSYVSPKIIIEKNFDPCNAKSKNWFSLSNLPNLKKGDYEIKNLFKDQSSSTTTNAKLIFLNSKESKGIDIFLKKQGYQLNDQKKAQLENLISDDYNFLIIEAEDSDGSKSLLPPIKYSYQDSSKTIPNFINFNQSNQYHKLNMIFLSKDKKTMLENLRTKKIDSNYDISTEMLGLNEQFIENAITSSNLPAVLLFHGQLYSPTYFKPEDAPEKLELTKLGVDWIPQNDKNLLGLAWFGNYVYLTSITTGPNYRPIDVKFDQYSEKDNFQTIFFYRKFIKNSDQACKIKYLKTITAK